MARAAFVIAGKPAPTQLNAAHRPRSFFSRHRHLRLQPNPLALALHQEIRRIAQRNEAKAPVQRRPLGLVHRQEHEQRTAQGDAQQRHQRVQRRPVLEVAQLAAFTQELLAEAVLRQGNHDPGHGS